MLDNEGFQKALTAIESAVSELDEITRIKLYLLISQYGSVMYRGGSKDSEKISRSQTVGGIKTPKEVIDLISVLYPDYATTGSGYDIQANQRRYNLLIADYKQLLKKEEFAISGAMRWEFSQEAPTWIISNYKYTDYKPFKLPRGDFDDTK
jgi:hypothetical protein